MKQSRRKGALKRLEAQLVSGVKPAKQSAGTIPLNEHDKSRIKGEIKTLKERIK